MTINTTVVIAAFIASVITAIVSIIALRNKKDVPSVFLGIVSGAFAGIAFTLMIVENRILERIDLLECYMALKP